MRSRKNLRPNGYPLVSARDCEIPDRVLERIAQRTAREALLVPRSKKPCDLWLGSLNNSGCPSIGWFDADAQVDRVGSVAVIQYRIHRLDGGPFPRGKLACHTCDVHSCVNPEHLYLGDPVFNGSDLRHRGSALDQGVLELEVRRQLQLRRERGRGEALWLLRQADRLRQEAA
jgi:hypothetical protein